VVDLQDKRRPLAAEQPHAPDRREQAGPITVLGVDIADRRRGALTTVEATTVITCTISSARHLCGITTPHVTKGAGA